LLQSLRPTTRVAVSSGLTLPQAMSRCDSVQRWREGAPPVGGKTPAVFALGA
jgi:16S rRNA (cytidine1402-2'-O)-methyltransferase